MWRYSASEHALHSGNSVVMFVVSWQCWAGDRLDMPLLLLLQIGMFCYTGMTPEMVDQLAGMSIYLTR